MSSELAERARTDADAVAHHGHPPAGVGGPRGELHAVVARVVGGRHRVPVRVARNSG